MQRLDHPMADITNFKKMFFKWRTGQREEAGVGPRRRVIWGH